MQLVLQSKNNVLPFIFGPHHDVLHATAATTTKTHGRITLQYYGMKLTGGLQVNWRSPDGPTGSVCPFFGTVSSRLSGLVVIRSVDMCNPVQWWRWSIAGCTLMRPSTSFSAA